MTGFANDQEPAAKWSAEPAPHPPMMPRPTAGIGTSRSVLSRTLCAVLATLWPGERAQSPLASGSGCRPQPGCLVMLGITAKRDHHWNPRQLRRTPSRCPSRLGRGRYIRQRGGVDNPSTKRWAIQVPWPFPRQLHPLGEGEPPQPPVRPAQGRCDQNHRGLPSAAPLTALCDKTGAYRAACNAAPSERGLGLDWGWAGIQREGSGYTRSRPPECHPSLAPPSNHLDQVADRSSQAGAIRSRLQRLPTGTSPSVEPKPDGP